MKQHDERCELLPGGRYDGLLLAGLPVPCHCPARAEGIAQAERELARARRQLIAPGRRRA